MKNLLYGVLALVASAAFASTTPDKFVTVRPDGNFYCADTLYTYVGTNLWYGAILGSEGTGGDRSRLCRELDTLQSLGINNLRVMVGAEGRDSLPCHIMPVLQTAPGVYNDTLLMGLDYLLYQLEQRDMKAVLYLNNAWEWSGGYGAYLEWAGYSPAPVPAIDGYRPYCEYVAQFVLSDSAKALAARHVRAIVSRTNSITGRPYTLSPAIMAWQIANEPRAFAPDSLHKEAFARWIASQAALIKSIDPNHLVSTGSEGRFGCEYDIDLWRRIHLDPNIDYGIIHLWPYNWRWADSTTLLTGLDTVRQYSLDYILPHAEMMRAAAKPLVLEEFGYPRDGMGLAPGSPTEARNSFYRFVLGLVGEDKPLAGCNFWGWGGLVTPASDTWRPGQPYTGDPAQEPQGLYSVFAADTATTAIIRQAARRCVSPSRARTL